MIKKVTEQELQNNRTGYVLVDFYADWCGPCKMIGPFLEELSETITDVQFNKVNIDEEVNLVGRYNVRSVPTLIIFKDGKEVDRHVGFSPKPKLESWIKNTK